MENYTLPGVMHYLRTEWQQRERARIEWEIERADLRSRLGRIEMEKHALEAERDALKRHIEVLAALRTQPQAASSSTSAGAVDSTDSGKPETKSTEAKSTEAKSTETKSSEAKSSETKSTETETAAALQAEADEAVDAAINATAPALISSVNDSREFLAHCLADIKSVLMQSGVPADLYTDVRLPRHLSTEFPMMTTLTNFGVSARAVAVISNGRIVGGTESGDLLVWESKSTESRRFGELGAAVRCMEYVAQSQHLYVAAGQEVLLYDVQFFPQLVGRVTQPAEILHLGLSPHRDLATIVLADGSSRISTLCEEKSEKEGVFKLSRTVNSLPGCTSGGFAVVDDKLHVVLTRNAPPAAAASSSSDNGSSSSSAGSHILLVDPHSGHLLRKVTIASRAISCMCITADYIVIGTDSGELRVLGLARGGTQAEAVAGHRARITSLSLAGPTLVATCADGRVSMWSLPTLAWKGRLMSHDSAFGALSSSCTAETVAIGGGDGLIRVYETK